MSVREEDLVIEKGNTLTNIKIRLDISEYRS